MALGSGIYFAAFWMILVSFTLRVGFAAAKVQTTPVGVDFHPNAPTF
jgi:hypothetical protein